MTNKSSKKRADGAAKGSISAFTDDQKRGAIERVRELLEDGRSAMQARKEAGAELRVSESTIRRWALALGEVITRGNQKRTEAATEAIRQYTGADYRRMASRVMRVAIEGMDEVEARRKELKAHGAEGIAMASKVSMMLSRGVDLEKKLIELGFGLDPADQGAGDEERGDNVIDWEAEAAEVRRLRAERDAEDEG